MNLQPLLLSQTIYFDIQSILPIIPLVKINPLSADKVTFGLLCQLRVSLLTKSTASTASFE